MAELCSHFSFVLFLDKGEVELVKLLSPPNMLFSIRMLYHGEKKKVSVDVLSVVAGTGFCRGSLPLC